MYYLLWLWRSLLHFFFHSQFIISRAGWAPFGVAVMLRNINKFISNNYIISLFIIAKCCSPQDDGWLPAQSLKRFVYESCHWDLCRWKIQLGQGGCTVLLCLSTRHQSELSSSFVPHFIKTKVRHLFDRLTTTLILKYLTFPPFSGSGDQTSWHHQNNNQLDYGLPSGKCDQLDQGARWLGKKLANKCHPKK